MSNMHSIGGGDVKLWIDQECAHLKAIDTNGDPVELTNQDCLDLIAALNKLMNILGHDE